MEATLFETDPVPLEPDLMRAVEQKVLLLMEAEMVQLMRQLPMELPQPDCMLDALSRLHLFNLDCPATRH